MMTPDAHLRSRHRVVLLASCLALTALIAGVDYATGYELNLSILYLAPVFISAWIAGRNTAVIMSLIAVIAWLLSGLPSSNEVYPHLFYHLWDAIIKFVTLALFAIVISKLKVALDHADERFVTVLEGLDAAVYVLDMNTNRILYANDRFRRTFDNGDAPLDVREGEFQDVRRRRWYLIHSRAIRWVDGNTVRLQMATDISERKKAEELNRQQQEKLQLTARLITVGEMASTLAHELNQPLAAIANYNMGCVRRLRSNNWEAAELLAAMEKSSAQAERAGKIIQRVREFVRKREPVLVACSLNDVITGVATMIETEAEKSSVELGLELGAALPPVRADRIMIEQVILNLVRNAIEAMQDVAAGDRRLVIRSSDGAVDMVEVAVVDNGEGVDPELEGSLFTPFSSTKPHGMGLGLHICRSIIEIHAGRMWVSRNPERGSTFHFSLPAAPA